MDVLFRTHEHLVSHVNAPVRRTLMDDINWNSRLIGIKGTRGVGKTTFLLQYAKENFRPDDKRCLYVNMNNFYFQGRGIADFAEEYQAMGGKVLLIDQVFKQPNWSSELRRCYDSCPKLKIVFTGSSVMRLKDSRSEIANVVDSYNLRGFSFREFLNLTAGTAFEPVTLDDILSNHEDIVNDVLKVTSTTPFFNDYLHHGFYPFFQEQRNYSENLLKTMNMMIEVDILLVKQMDLRYLLKLKKLFYLLAMAGGKAPNVSALATNIHTSRATVINYTKYLADARLINIIYPVGNNFPQKPAKVMMHNTNLMFAIYPNHAPTQELMETFFVNTLWKDHIVNQRAREYYYFIDRSKRFRVIDATEGSAMKQLPETTYVVYNSERGSKDLIPLWLFGFLY